MVEFHIGNPRTFEAQEVGEDSFRLTMVSLKRKWGKIPQPQTGEDPLDGIIYRQWRFPDKDLWVICDCYEELEELNL